MLEEGIRKLIIEAAYRWEAILSPMPPMDRMVTITDRIDASEIVFAVWKDDAEPLSHSLMIVKGQQRLRELTNVNDALFLKIAAIKCLNAQQAEALLYLEGEPE